MLNQLLLTSYRSIVMKKRERERAEALLSLLISSSSPEILHQQKQKFEKLIDLPKKGPPVEGIGSSLKGCGSR